MKKRYFIPLLIFVGLIFFLWQGIGHDPHQLPSALMNRSVPVFEVPSLLPNQVPLKNTTFQNRVVLLHVFASWCETCREEVPILLTIAKNKNVALYGLNYKDQKNAARKFLTQYGNPYRGVGFDASGSVGMDFGVYGTPETFLIDKTGKIRYKQVGPLTEESWQDIILPKIKALSR